MNTQHLKSLSFIFLLSTAIIFSPSIALSEEDVFVHRAPVDTVQWISRDDGVIKPPLGETQLEGPGEQLGLIGPIIASGGSGDKEFITIYDAAGVLVATISKKEARKNPDKFVALVRLAQLRSEMQNTHALTSLRNRALENRKAQAGDN
jgi:hypothetical protein